VSKKVEREQSKIFEIFFCGAKLEGGWWIITWSEKKGGKLMAAGRKQQIIYARHVLLAWALEAAAGEKCNFNAIRFNSPLWDVFPRCLQIHSHKLRFHPEE
jgi:hypothetical protein